MNGHRLAEKVQRELAESDPQLEIDVTQKRLRTQLRCTEYLRRAESESVGFEVSEEDAMRLWHVRGHTKTFAELYKPDSDPEELYEKIVH